MSLPQLQEMDRPAKPLSPVRQEYTFTVKTRTINILDPEESSLTAAFKEVVGRGWHTVYARPGEPGAARKYRVHVGPAAIPGIPVRLFAGSSMVDEKRTDSSGEVLFDLSGLVKNNIGKALQLTATMLPQPAPLPNPLQDTFKLAVYIVKVTVRNETDRWLRWVGRSFMVRLPRVFWSYNQFVIGLAHPRVPATFIDVVPVLPGMSFELEYGVSAWCNTPEARPPPEKCREYRKNTFWNVEVEATYIDVNGNVRRGTASGRLNVDKHLRVSIMLDGVRGRLVEAA